MDEPTGAWSQAPVASLAGWALTSVMCIQMTRSWPAVENVWATFQEIT